MICIILAAGLGLRLKPLTDFTPKCLIEVNSKPILSYWLDKLSNIGQLNEVIINTHHLSDKVRDYIDKNNTRYHYKITEFYEPKLLGSAGTLNANKEKMRNNDVLVIYADNFSEIDLKSFYRHFLIKKEYFNLAVFETEDPKSCGIFEAIADGTVLSFEEKPNLPKSNLANAGIYLFEGTLYLNNITGKEFDIGYDIIPKMISQLNIYKINGYHVDIGTYEALEKANKFAL